jgi:uncharacterized RDD family membrane protein YckC
MYQVIGSDGQVYGPVDVSTLKEWASRQRLLPQTMMIDPISGQTLPAAQVLANHDVFPASAPPLGMPMVAVPTQVTAAATWDGSGTFAQSGNVVADAALGARFCAFLIDLILSVPLAALGAIPVVGFLFAPLLCLYWLSRDSFFGGQSVGKRVLGLRAVREDGQPFTWGDSAKRNIVYIGLLLEAIPIAGPVLFGTILALTGLLEFALVLFTGRRLGDRLGGTRVAAA